MKKIGLLKLTFNYTTTGIINFDLQINKQKVLRPYSELHMIKDTKYSTALKIEYNSHTIHESYI